MPPASNDSQPTVQTIALHREISQLSTKVERMQQDVHRLYKMVSTQNESLNRWRGMGAALTMLGVVFGGVVGGIIASVGRDFFGK
jgi:hypothetical protein